MATGSTSNYDLPYPLAGDPVDVHGDIKLLADNIDLILANIEKPNHNIQVTNSTTSNIAKGDPVYVTGYSLSTLKTTVGKCNPSDSSTFPVIGLAENAISAGSDGVVIISGVFDNINMSAYNAGDILYVATGGGLTTTQPASSPAVGIVVKNTATGAIVIRKSSGQATWGSVKSGLI